MTKAGRLPCNANSSVDLFQRRCWMQKRLCLLRVPDFQFTVSCLIESFKFGAFLRRAWALQIQSFVPTALLGRGSCGITGDSQVRVRLKSKGRNASPRSCKPVWVARWTEQQGQDGPFLQQWHLCPVSLRPALPRSRREAQADRGHQRAAQDLCRSAPASSPALRGETARTCAVNWFFTA